MKTYQATAERDGNWWMVSIPEIDGLTQARNLAEADKMARSLIAISLDIAPDSFAVSVEAVLPPEFEREMSRSQLLYEQADSTARQAAEARKAAAMTLAGMKLPVRDIGAILGVSHQRAHQLVSA